MPCSVLPDETVQALRDLTRLRFECAQQAVGEKVRLVGIGVDADPGDPHFFEFGHGVDHGVAAPLAAVGGAGDGHAANFFVWSLGAGVGAGQKAEGGEHPAAGTAFSFFSICEVDHEVKCISRRFLPGHNGR